MKKILNINIILAIGFLCGLFLQSCDKIDEPYTRSGGGSGDTGESSYRVCVYLIEDSIVAAQKNNNTELGPKDWLDYVHNHVLRGSLNGTWGSSLSGGTAVTAGDTTKVQRKVLLEEFTGHLCVNCPTATAKAMELKTTYGDNLYIIGIHAGSFAEPASTGNYTADFRNTVSNELYSFFSVIVNPIGMINRHQYNNKRLIPYGQWSANISEMMSNKTDVKIGITPNYNASSRELGVALQIRANGKNYSMNFNGFAVNSGWRANHCAIVAFVYDKETLEIFQVEEKELAE